MSAAVRGLFRFRDGVLKAITRLKEAGFQQLDVMAPIPDHEILKAVEHPPSKVGLVTLIGGIAGLIVGFGGAAWAHWHWGSIIGGKPVVSIPPLVVVAFELTVLFSALATMAGVLLMCRLPRRKLDPFYDPQVSEDGYLIVVGTEESRAADAAAILAEEGAEVRR